MRWAMVLLCAASCTCSEDGYMPSWHPSMMPLFITVETHSGWKPAFDEGARWWETKVGEFLFFVTEDDKPIDGHSGMVGVRVTQQPAEYELAALAFCESSPDGRHIVACPIEVAQAGSLTPHMVRDVARHELGHVLGLRHTSARRAVMNPRDVGDELSALERAWLQERYAR